MAMEQVQIIKDTHTKSITAVGYNPIKHEILAGFEGILGWLLAEPEIYYDFIRYHRDFHLYLLDILDSFKHH